MANETGRIFHCVVMKIYGCVPVWVVFSFGWNENGWGSLWCNYVTHIRLNEKFVSIYGINNEWVLFMPSSLLHLFYLSQSSISEINKQTTHETKIPLREPKNCNYIIRTTTATTQFPFRSMPFQKCQAFFTSEQLMAAKHFPNSFESFVLY